MRKFLMLILAILIGVFLIIFPVFAADLSVNPIIIDEKAKVRDIFKESVTITNETYRKINIYSFVNNITAEEGRQEFSVLSGLNLAESLANWILFPRGVIELAPGEAKKIDFKIEVNLRAKPGTYHALISFSQGSTRAEAEKALASAPSLAVNVEVEDDVKEQMQLKEFQADKSISNFPVTFSYAIENIGNRPLAPKGEIRIYNRRGKEITSIKINEKNIQVEPGAAAKLASVWQSGRGFGKYKALLNLKYGIKQPNTLQDTIFFWVIPQKELIFLIGGLALGNLLFFVLWRRGYEKYQECRRRKQKNTKIQKHENTRRFAPQNKKTKKYKNRKN